jgi:ATP-dependent RNA helicase DHX8/PRP22
MRDVCAIDQKWLIEVAPKYFKTSDKNTLSKRKRDQKIVPLFNRYEDPDAWRLSMRKE